MRGIPDTAPSNVMSTGMLAEQNQWTVRPTYVTKPVVNITLRFYREGCPRIWATWNDGRFWRSYTNTAQRLSYRDLLSVLRDPSPLLDIDAENPFGHTED